MRKIATMLAAAALAGATLAAAPPASASSYFPPADFDQCVAELASQVQQVDDLEEAGRAKDAQISLLGVHVRALEFQANNYRALIQWKHARIVRQRHEIRHLRAELQKARAEG